MQKILHFLQRPEISAILAFLPKFGCHGNCLAFLEIIDSTFEFADVVEFAECRYLVQK